jgi:hypothetical protein
MNGWKLSQHIADVHNLITLYRADPPTSLELKPEYCCSLCGKCFSVESALKLHVEREHPKPKQQDEEQILMFPCDLCLMTYTDITLYANHVSKHYEEQLQVENKLKEEKDLALEVQRTIQNNYKEFLSQKLSNNK